MTLDTRLIRFSPRDTAMRKLGQLEARFDNAWNPAERDGLDLQIQAVLRTMPGPGK
jgi:hypothetical protein|tara:strand:+ start:449 stop:616 length:168 start_codon:yes stop_codon:yes gene_type:complete